MHSWIACVVRNDHGLRGPARVEIDGERSGARWEPELLQRTLRRTSAAVKTRTSVIPTWNNRMVRLDTVCGIC